MSKMIICFLVAVLLTMITPNNLAGSQRRTRQRAEAPDRKDGLQISIDMDSETYHLRDVATLRITLENVGASPFLIYNKFGWGRSSSFTLSISDERGRPIERTMLADALHAPPFLKEDFITVAPGESIKQERDIDLEGEELTKTGAYRITVWYHSPIPKESAPEVQRLWAKENGVLRAKPLTFRIIQ